MGVSSLERMLDQLVETGLISKQQFNELRARKNPDDTLPSVTGVTRRLVSKGVLTDFQAGLLSDGNPDRLVFGEYVLVDLLGNGGMGEVYLARHRMMNREVAIKLLVPRSSELIESIERFKREVRVAARLSHPNVVTALDAGMRDGQYYLVMECVRGRNLAALVRSQGAIRLDRALDYTIQAGQGLEYAHRQGIVHRDIKPSNLLLDEDGTVKVSDLGLSRVLQPDGEVTQVNDQGDGLTSSGMIMGTVDFMAPEQAVKPQDADERADVYGLGCTLYFLATGTTVFTGDTPMARLIAHREQPVPALTEALPGAPALLDRILQKMLAKDPDDRYASISDALRDLRSALRQYQEGHSDLPETVCRTSEESAPGRRSALVPLAALIAMAAALVALTLVWTPGATDSGTDESGGRSDSHNPSVAQSPEPAGTRAPELHRLTAESEPLNVLEILDLDTVRKNGEGWHFENGRDHLVTGVAGRVRLSLPVLIPESYWLSLEVRRLPDPEYAKGPFVIGLTVGDSQCIAAFDAHRATGARISFLGNDRISRTTLFTSTQHRIPEDEFVTIRIEVDVQASDIASIRAAIDDSEPLTWEGDPADIEISVGWSSDWPEPLFLATNLATQYEIRNFRIGPGPLPSTPSAEPASQTPSDNASSADADSPDEDSPGADRKK